MPVLWFHTSMCFQYLSKTFTKCCSNNFLLSCNKSISCLIWLVTCFWFQNMFWKNINCFRFRWKTYTMHCTSNYEDFLPLHFVDGQVLSFSGYDLEKRTWWWKSWFWFCAFFVYFADLIKPFILHPVSVVTASCFDYILALVDGFSLL